MAGATTAWRRGLLAVLLAPSLALAHARLVAPPPRTTTILKTPPCGGIARTSTPVTLTAGEPLQVDWVETIDHPGHYELAISPADDLGFVTLLGNIPDFSFASGATERAYSTTIQVPSTPCDACTLQLIQFMSDHPPGSQYYYSCADIRIVAAATTTTTATTPDGSTSTTTTSSPPDCGEVVSYDRARCLIAEATAHSICGSETVGARLQHTLDAGFATVTRLLDRATAPGTSAKRATHRLEMALRRLAVMRRKAVVAGDRGRLELACAQTIVGRLDDLRAAIEPLAP
jgi:hypothetical protein